MKTALIFTGGTICSSVADDGYIAPAADGRYAILEGYEPDGFNIFSPYTILSENLGDEHITALLRCVRSAFENHDGVIVLHGTDTLQYSAAAVSYAFGSDTSPVVFVSSNYILSDPRANGRSNFAAAVDFVKNGRGRGTFISYKNAGEPPKIHRAARVLDYAPYSDAVNSIGGEYGRYEGGIFVKNPDYSERADEIKPLGIPDLTKARVKRVSAYPGLKIENADAALLETYHSGTVCEKSLDTSIPVFVLGVEDRIQYASVKAYDRKNVTVLRKAAAPAMYMKLKMCAASVRLGDMNKTLGGDFKR